MWGGQKQQLVGWDLSWVQCQFIYPSPVPSAIPWKSTLSIEVRVLMFSCGHSSPDSLHPSSPPSSYRKSYVLVLCPRVQLLATPGRVSLTTSSDPVKKRPDRNTERERSREHNAVIQNIRFSLRNQPHRIRPTTYVHDRKRIPRAYPI